VKSEGEVEKTNYGVYIVWEILGRCNCSVAEVCRVPSVVLLGLLLNYAV